VISVGHVVDDFVRSNILDVVVVKMAEDTEDKVSPVDSLVSVVVSVKRLGCEESLFNP
jgi:hypothetical protein